VGLPRRSSLALGLDAPLAAAELWSSVVNRILGRVLLVLVVTVVFHRRATA
jgi:hypothetical protein